jgi:Holliday junction resolvase RusA-like endonuclease
VPSLIVYTEPVAKARPRVTVQNGRARAYTPSKTQEAEWRIRTEWIAAHGLHPLAGPVYLVVIAYVAMPKSMPQKRREGALPVTRPDADNYLKTAQDALNEVAWADDSQVVDLRVAKRYAIDGPPRWELEVGEATA